MKKVLVVDEMHHSIFRMLEDNGFEADYRPEITKDEVALVLPYYYGIFIRSKIELGKKLLESAPDLRFIARAGAGIEKIDVETANRLGIQLINAPEGNRDAVAEHVIGMLLSLMNRLHLADQEVRNDIWDREGNRGTELGGKTIGIIGYGNTGKSLASRLAGFGCHILAYDKYKSGFSDEYVTETSLYEIQHQTDILSLHIPLTEETSKMADKAYFSMFRKPFWFANTSRGETVVTSDLLDAIDEGRILGAALDVLETEGINQLKLQNQAVYNRLISNNKIMLTPHVAGWTKESYYKINEVLIEKIRQLGL